MELSTSKTRGRMGTSFGHSDFWLDFWDHFGGKSVSYDWWMVFKATINQSTSKPKQSQKSLPARTLVRILLRYSFRNEEFWFKRRRDPIRFKISPSRKLPSK